jgi:hypothetical protein
MRNFIINFCVLWINAFVEDWTLGSVGHYDSRLIDDNSTATWRDQLSCHAACFSLSLKENMKINNWLRTKRWINEFLQLQELKMGNEIHIILQNRHCETDHEDTIFLHTIVHISIFKMLVVRSIRCCAQTIIITVSAMAVCVVIDLPAERSAVIGLLSAVGDDATRARIFIRCCEID